MINILARKEEFIKTIVNITLRNCEYWSIIRFTDSYGQGVPQG